MHREAPGEGGDHGVQQPGGRVPAGLRPGRRRAASGPAARLAGGPHRLPPRRPAAHRRRGRRGPGPAPGRRRGTLRAAGGAGGLRRGGTRAVPDRKRATMTTLRSRTIFEGDHRAGARSFLYGLGYTREDLGRPIIGVSHCWTDTMPCNFNHRILADAAKRGVRDGGGTPMEFSTIAISDGITMGTQGMNGSLVSPEVIADSIELVADSHMFDAMVCVGGCAQTTPGAAMALARLDVPGVILYSGTIAPGRFRGRTVAVGDVFEAIGAVAAGPMSPPAPPDPYHGA